MFLYETSQHLVDDIRLPDCIYYIYYITDSVFV